MKSKLYHNEKNWHFKKYSLITTSHPPQKAIPGLFEYLKMKGKTIKLLLYTNRISLFLDTTQKALFLKINRFIALKRLESSIHQKSWLGKWKGKLPTQRR